MNSSEQMVYAVYGELGECSRLLSLWSSRDKAEAARRAYQRRGRWDGVSVAEWLVDGGEFAQSFEL